MNASGVTERPAMHGTPARLGNCRATLFGGLEDQCDEISIADAIVSHL